MHAWWHCPSKRPTVTSMACMVALPNQCTHFDDGEVLKLAHTACMVALPKQSPHLDDGGVLKMVHTACMVALPNQFTHLDDDFEAQLVQHDGSQLQVVPLPAQHSGRPLHGHALLLALAEVFCAMTGAKKGGMGFNRHALLLALAEVLCAGVGGYTQRKDGK